MTELPNTVHRGESLYAQDEFLTWRAPDHRSPHRTCGYCGSLHPEDFANARVAQGGRIEVADMKYGWPHKVYIDLENPAPDRLYVIGGIYEATAGPWAPGGDKYTPPGEGYIALADLTDEQRDIATRDGTLREGSRQPAYIRFGTRPSLHAKFYTIHLLEPDLDPAVKDKCEARIGYTFAVSPTNPSMIRWSRYTYPTG